MTTPSEFNLPGEGDVRALCNDRARALGVVIGEPTTWTCPGPHFTGIELDSQRWEVEVQAPQGHNFIATCNHEIEYRAQRLLDVWLMMLEDLQTGTEECAPGCQGCPDRG